MNARKRKHVHYLTVVLLVTFLSPSLRLQNVCDIKQEL